MSKKLSKVKGFRTKNDTLEFKIQKILRELDTKPSSKYLDQPTKKCEESKPRLSDSRQCGKTKVRYEAICKNIGIDPEDM